MLGRSHTSPVFAAACVALAVTAAACNPDSATTGPSGTHSADFAANLRTVSGDQQLGPVGAALTQPIVVKVVDAGGQPVQGATVAFSVRAGGGSINPAANVSDANGLVSSNWTMGKTLGANKAVATLTSAFVLDSATFTATATTGPVSTFVLLSGNAQTANAGNALPAPLAVKAQDAFGNNLSGIKVTWTPAALNGSVSFVADTTGADGTASASWTLGIGATAQALSASVTGLTPLSFTAVATPDTGRILTVTGGAAQTGPVSAPLATAPSVRVTDEYGNVISGASITWTDSITGGGTVSTIVGATSAAGTASTTWTLGKRAGAQLVRAKLTGRTETATFTANATVAFSNVYAGNFMACGIVASNNNVYCWGANGDGQLGKGPTAFSTNAPTAAVPVAGDTASGVPMTIRQLSGGRNGFCALTLAQTMYCWGRPFGGGTATATTLSSGGATVFPNYLAVGQDFGCLMILAGNGYCSGNNINGQLGNGGAAGTAWGTFTAIVAPPTLFSSISVGRVHACGLPRYNGGGVAASMTPVCWGLNDQGQLGNGATVSSNTPVAITPPAAGSRFDSTSMVTGADFSCALEAANSITPGTAWCWGGNGFGQLGNGTTTASSIPVAVTVSAGVLFSKVYAGEFHACAIESATSVSPGKAWCWGRNDYGQLGSGSVSAPVSTAAAVVGGLAFRSLSIGELYTCGVVGPATIPGSPSQSAGTIYCWGDNSSGQLGNGVTGGAAVASPIRVSFQP